ncbi:non-ribosomal peptide synthetase [Pseudomonas sp. ZL2]
MTDANPAEIFQTSAQQALILQAQSEQPRIARLWLNFAEPVEPGRLEAVLSELGRRHEILRTRYTQVAGLKLPVQEIAEQVRVSIALVHTEAQARAQLNALLEQAPLVACVAGAQVLVGVALASADEQALGQLAEEILALYRGDTLAPFEALQYADYAAWQADLDEEAFARQGKAYWRGLAAAQAPGRRLPFEAIEQGAGERNQCQRLSPGLNSALAVMQAEAGLAPPEALLFLWGSFLSVLTRQQPLLVALEVDGRNDQLQHTLGHFARRLPQAFNLQPGLALREQLAAFAVQLAEGRSWLDCLNEPDMSAAGALPVFACAYTQAPAAEQWRVELDDYRNDKLFLSARAQADGVCLQLSAPGQGFAPAQLQAWLAQFDTFALNAAADLGCAPEQLNTVDAEQAAALLARFDRSLALPAAADDALHGLFEQMAALHPQRIALQIGDQRLSYAELDRRADELARALQACGVGGDSVVAVYGSRSVEIVVALLGILKAGGAYLPLDPGYPAERLSFMLHDARAQCLISLQPLADDIEVAPGVQRLQLDALPPSDLLPLRKRHSAASLAYVIYTSGSTGKPKGVMISHANACASTRARGLFYRQPLLRFLMLSSFSFDSSVAGIFWSLAQGGTLCLPGEEEHKDPQRLAALIEREQISHFLALPSFYAQILEHLEQPALSCVIVAGEACPPELAVRHRQRLAQTLLVNEYGPSESAVWCSAHALEQDPQGERVPIGAPIAGARLLALDEAGEMAGFGCEGELYVGGPGLARGYLQRPGLTASRFVPDPFAKEPGQRLYRTGDRVSAGVDGCIDYLGRLDFQLKIRGFRIELGEIESRLAQLPGVREAAVVVRESAAGAQLAAYVLHTDGQTPASTEQSLLDALREQLPEYMVPAFVRVLERFPLTPNGKLDRNALAALQPQSHEFVAPRNELEATLAAIWQEALHLEQVGIHDNFFALGGHSLLATRIRSEVQARLNLNLPLRVFFEGETVALLAEQVAQYRDSGLSESKVDALEALFDAAEQV